MKQYTIQSWISTRWSNTCWLIITSDQTFSRAKSIQVSNRPGQDSATNSCEVVTVKSTLTATPLSCALKSLEHWARLKVSLPQKLPEAHHSSIIGTLSLESKDTSCQKLCARFCTCTRAFEFSFGENLSFLESQKYLWGKKVKHSWF